jgi:hypothetical protein
MTTVASHPLINYIKYRRVAGRSHQHRRVPASAMVSDVAPRGEHGSHDIHETDSTMTTEPLQNGTELNSGTGWSVIL